MPSSVCHGVWHIQALSERVLSPVERAAVSSFEPAEQVFTHAVMLGSTVRAQGWGWEGGKALWAGTRSKGPLWVPGAESHRGPVTDRVGCILELSHPESRTLGYSQRNHKDC